MAISPFPLTMQTVIIWTIVNKHKNKLHVLLLIQLICKLHLSVQSHPSDSPLHPNVPLLSYFSQTVISHLGSKLASLSLSLLLTYILSLSSDTLSDNLKVTGLQELDFFRQKRFTNLK